MRLFIHHQYIDADALRDPPNSDELGNTLKTIKTTDWREGFSSLILFPILWRKLSDKHLLDLLMGRKRLMFFFNPDRFVDLCNRSGLDASLTSKKEVDRLKSRGEAKGLMEFDGRCIHYSSEEANWMLGEGILGEMFYNWLRPISIVQLLKSTQLPRSANWQQFCPPDHICFYQLSTREGETGSFTRVLTERLLWPQEI